MEVLWNLLQDMNSLSDDTDECEDESSEEEKTTVKVFCIHNC